MVVCSGNATSLPGKITNDGGVIWRRDYTLNGKKIVKCLTLYKTITPVPKLRIVIMVYNTILIIIEIIFYYVCRKCLIFFSFINFSLETGEKYLEKIPNKIN